MVIVCAYSFQALLGSYIRTIFGMVLTLGPLLLLNPTSVIVYLLGFLLCLFILYGVRTVIRQITYLEANSVGLHVKGPFAKLIGNGLNWEEMRSFKLEYFSTRRDREAGWLHLRIKGNGRRLSIDSTISNFEKLTRLAYGQAKINNIEIDPATGRNLQVLGIDRFADASARVGRELD
jgi:hypothetical protein